MVGRLSGPRCPLLMDFEDDEQPLDCGAKSMRLFIILAPNFTVNVWKDFRLFMSRWMRRCLPWSTTHPSRSPSPSPADSSMTGTRHFYIVSSSQIRNSSKTCILVTASRAEATDIDFTCKSP
ncbi:hypothetical protein Hypma_014614 [Hypsizygus marmoreus]|uniref:Uncharacterized protein n=1 Tax=Hypsizygus marmoreus TaxID=39966 RepID=A0A369J9H5_HYPMA|nr:hypothetical protein Hypma_014614 [Hypsizygus marmoreus]